MIFENYQRQNYPNKELIIVLNNDKMSLEEWRLKAKNYENVQVFQLPESATLGECRNFGIQHAQYDYIANFDDDDYYGPNYLVNAMKIFEYIDADIIGKLTTYIYFEESKKFGIYLYNRENQYVRHVPDATIIAKKHVFDKVKFPSITLGVEKVFLRNCLRKGFKLYSGDRFDYVIIRKANKNEHTWQDSDHDLLKTCKVLAETSNFTDLVERK
ncbi:MAG: glycosyltransferase family 2 protein [Tissierellia bacterium]|nr:glycosyltransferase family 2 protein [Tissierellia bacterium]